MTAIETAIEIVDASPRRATASIGSIGPGFEELLGTDGDRHAMADFADASILVLVFSSNRCPTAKAYADRLIALQRDYDRDGVQVLALNSNDPSLYPAESYPRMVERATEDGYAFPYLVDDGQRLAKAYGAACTFHVFVLDRDRRIRYTGRFDDSRLPANVTRRHLADALDDLIAGRAVGTPTTRPFGCSLDIVSV